MKNLFQKASSPWVRYSEYEYKKARDGYFYITPAAGAKPEVYDPLKNVERMVLDALNVGALQMNRKGEAVVREAVMEFVSRYGLLGFLTALPTTPSFMDYKAVYLPKNHFVREESMPTQGYLALFFPFEKLDIQKKGTESRWNLTGDRAMMALALTMQDAPQAVSMSFQREYAERYDWLARQFKDLAFSFYSSLGHFTRNYTQTVKRAADNKRHYAPGKGYSACLLRGYPKGATPHLAHDFAKQSVVCYTLCRRCRENAVAAGEGKGI